MFYKYLITNLNGKKIIYLYFNQDYEISSDLYILKDNQTLIEKAKNYLEHSGVSYKGKEIYLVVDNVIVGKLQIKRLLGSPRYLEYVRFGKSYRVDFLDPNEHPDIKLVDIHRSSGVIDRLKFYEYLFGVVAREMPYIDQIECLKAQAVLARTYLVKCHLEQKPLRDINQYQLYFDQSYLKRLWKDHYFEYRSKILEALKDTQGEILTFHGKCIECYSHYQNAGKTEDSKNILKLSYPYLVSVDSMDYHTPDLLRYRKVSNQYLSKLLNVDIHAGTPVYILESTSGNNVRYIQFGTKVFDGLLLSRALGLLSNHFTVQVHDDYTTFLTKGCGHGLGLSKCGAKVMAESGYDYRQILNHYYPNTTLEKLSESIQ